MLNVALLNKNSYLLSTGRIKRDLQLPPKCNVCFASFADSCNDQIPSLFVWIEYCGKSDEEISTRRREPAFRRHEISHISICKSTISPGSYGIRLLSSFFLYASVPMLPRML